MYKLSGFSFLELLITLGVLSILLSLGVPSMLDSIKTQRLKNAAEAAYFSLSLAKSEAISRSGHVFVDFADGKNWCLGLSDKAICDCRTIGSCTLNAREYVVQARDYEHIYLSALRFAHNGTSRFEGSRGISAGYAGSLEFSDGSRQLKVILSNLGRVRLCVSGNKQVPGYQKC